jgi:hypothetical protein
MRASGRAVAYNFSGSGGQSHLLQQATAATSNAAAGRTGSGGVSPSLSHRHLAMTVSDVNPAVS